MRRGKALVGKDILSLADGRKIDTINDIILGPEGRSLAALLVDEGGFLSSSHVVPFAEVQSFGRDAVVVASEASVVSVGDQPELNELVDRHEKLIGKVVYSVEGNRQGAISDVFFDERSGEVVGYEVSGGLLGDMARGTSYLATDEVALMGTELIYVQPETERALEGQVGGLQGAIGEAGGKVRSAGERAGQRLGEVGDTVGGRASEVRPEERLIGRRTGADVLADDGEIIVPRGRRLRSEDIARARERGKTGALTAAVARADAEDAAGDAKDAVGSAADSAGNLWDQFTAKLSDMTDATGRRIDEEQTKRRLAQIEDAVGRPVTKVILDRGDNVILNFGDIITHEAIQRAHESGGLDSLLGSVYKGQVELNKGEMRVPVAADSTVERASGGAEVVEALERKVEKSEQARATDQERKRSETQAERERRAEERSERQAARDAERRQRKANHDATETHPATDRAVGPGRPVTAGARGVADDLSGQSERER